MSLSAVAHAHSADRHSAGDGVRIDIADLAVEPLPASALGCALRRARSDAHRSTPTGGYQRATGVGYQRVIG